MDRVERAIARWAEVRPDLDTSGMAVAGRLALLGSVATRVVEVALEPHALSPQAYSVLAVLRSHGAPKCQLTPSAIRDYTLLTSGGISNILARLEEMKLIARRPSATDGRGVVVRLTTRGKALIDAALEDVLAAQRALLASLDDTQAVELADALRRLGEALDAGPA